MFEPYLVRNSESVLRKWKILLIYILQLKIKWNSKKELLGSNAKYGSMDQSIHAKNCVFKIGFAYYRTKSIKQIIKKN